MAATVAQVPANNNTVMGNYRVSVVKVTGDTSYPSGGYALAPNQLGFADTVVFGDAGIAAVSASVTGAYFNPATQKLQLLTATGEVAAATNVSACAVQLIAYGY